MTRRGDILETRALLVANERGALRGVPNRNVTKETPGRCVTYCANAVRYVRRGPEPHDMHLAWHGPGGE